MAVNKVFNSKELLRASKIVSWLLKNEKFYGMRTLDIDTDDGTVIVEAEGSLGGIVAKVKVVQSAKKFNGFSKTKINSIKTLSEAKRKEPWTARLVVNEDIIYQDIDWYDLSKN